MTQSVEWSLQLCLLEVLSTSLDSPEKLPKLSPLKEPHAAVLFPNLVSSSQELASLLFLLREVPLYLPSLCLCLRVELGRG